MNNKLKQTLKMAEAEGFQVCSVVRRNGAAHAKVRLRAPNGRTRVVVTSGSSREGDPRLRRNMRALLRRIYRELTEDSPAERQP